MHMQSIVPEQSFSAKGNLREKNWARIDLQLEDSFDLQ